MARLSENTESYEDRFAEFARLRTIEDWKQNLWPLTTQGGSYAYGIGYISNQTSEFDTAYDDITRASASDALLDTDRADDDCFFPNKQISAKSESRPSIVEEFAPYFRKKTVENELRGYLHLEEGWNGANSVAPPELAVENAVLFLSRFPYDLTQPTPMVAADGEVGLYWRYQGAYVELEFTGDGIMFGYGCDLQGNEAFIDDVSVDSHEEMEEAIGIVSKIVAEFPLDDD